MLLTQGKSIWGNAFYRNDGKGNFEEVSDQIGAENYWPWGISVGDLNADGFDDVFIASSMNFPFRYGVNSVLLNNQGSEFLSSEFILGVEPRRSEEHTSELQSRRNLVCRLLLEKKKASFQIRRATPLCVS